MTGLARVAGAGLAVALALWPAAARADVEGAKSLYAGCVGCHGEAGVSATEKTPSLAGQPDVYTQWQLIHYRSGRRANEAMNGIAQALSDDDIRDLGGYLATLAPPAPVSAEPAASGEAKRIAVAARCATCHGDAYEGKQGAPRLAGQRGDYLLQTLRDFKSGARAGAGLVNMTEILAPVPDDALPGLAALVAAAP